jgi:hypothetical protein
MTWIRPVLIFLNFVVVYFGLFSRDRRGQLEIYNLIKFRAYASLSPDVAMVDAATPACAVWQLIGGILVLWLNVNAWHLLWWYVLGMALVSTLGKWLVGRIYRP